MLSLCLPTSEGNAAEGTNRRCVDVLYVAEQASTSKHFQPAMKPGHTVMCWCNGTMAMMRTESSELVSYAKTWHRPPAVVDAGCRLASPSAVTCHMSCITCHMQQILAGRHHAPPPPALAYICICQANSPATSNPLTQAARSTRQEIQSMQTLLMQPSCMWILKMRSSP